MAGLPLIRNHGIGMAFAYRGKRPASADVFLRDVLQLAASLPDRRYIINQCADRYRFAVGLAAALLRQQISLLPPNLTPVMIEQLKRCYPDVYCLTDGAIEPSALETVVYVQPSGGAVTAQAVPVVPATQVAAILFTSGSTGQPVPHQKSWGALVGSALAEIDGLGLEACRGMILVATVPPQHMYGLESSVLMAMQGGLTLYSGRPFFPADICAELEALPRPRGLVTTPVHLRALLEAMAELPPVDFLLCATAPLSPQLAAEAEVRFAASLHEIYGCTEAGQVATRRTVATPEWRTLSGISMRQDEKGTWVKGGHVETEVLLGDVIELLGPHRALLHGRTTDLVNIAGKRTSLAYLNYHLNSVEGVHDGAFIMPGEQEGEAVTRLMAFVVAPGLTAEAILGALRQRIDAAFLPRPLCLVESLPRNETGKLLRRTVEDLVARHAMKVE
jgi:acyl-coenzyme A synthetase/AMP-(fatty) acid ligase